MSHPRFGMAVACLAALILAVVAPMTATADFIRAGASGGTESVPDTAGGVPVSAPDPAVQDPIEHGRVGYALTTEEFIGGAIMLGLAIGTALVVGIKAGRNEL
jgi:hypothetical protein